MVGDGAERASVQESRSVRVELIASRSLSPKVRLLRFRSVGTPFLEWEAGQFLKLSLIEGSWVPYSIASSVDAERPGEFELCVARGSEPGSVAELPVGSVIEAEGPFGSFTRRVGGSHASVFVGVGTGLAPLRAMILADLSGAEAKTGQPLLLLFGCRNEGELLWRAELEELAQRTDRFRFEPTLSRPANGWSGRRGYVQEHFAELVGPLSEPDVYVCGMSDMVNDCVERLRREHAVPTERIFTEAY